MFLFVLRRPSISTLEAAIAVEGEFDLILATPNRTTFEALMEDVAKGCLLPVLAADEYRQ